MVRVVDVIIHDAQVSSFLMLIPFFSEIFRLKPVRTLCSYTLSRQLYGTDDVCVCGFVHQKAFRQRRDQGTQTGKTERRRETLLMGHFYCCRQPLKIKYPIVEKEEENFFLTSFVQNLGNKLLCPVLSWPLLYLPVRQVLPAWPCLFPPKVSP